MAKMATDPVHRSLFAPSASEWINRVSPTVLAQGIRPLMEPLFADAAARDILREGVTPDDAMLWMQIVAIGLIRSPDPLPSGDDLAALLHRMLTPVLFRGAG